MVAPAQVDSSLAPASLRLGSACGTNGGSACRAVFEQNEPGVQDLVVDEFEVDVREPGEDRLATSRSEDLGKDDQSEPVDQPELREVLHKGEAAHGPERITGFLPSERESRRWT